MVTIAVDSAKKSYKLSPHNSYKITGVSRIQNSGRTIIRVCENPIDTNNVGWTVRPFEVISIDSGTVYINAGFLGVNLEME